VLTFLGHTASNGRQEFVLNVEEIDPTCRWKENAKEEVAASWELTPLIKQEEWAQADPLGNRQFGACGGEGAHVVRSFIGRWMRCRCRSPGVAGDCRSRRVRCWRLGCHLLPAVPRR
jgi:hypothetical protein